MRRMKRPPCLRAKSQQNRAVRTPPMWSMPVGEGAKRVTMGRDMGRPQIKPIVCPKRADCVRAITKNAQRFSRYLIYNFSLISTGESPLKRLRSSTTGTSTTLLWGMWVVAAE